MNADGWFNVETVEVVSVFFGDDARRHGHGQRKINCMILRKFSQFFTTISKLVNCALNMVNKGEKETFGELRPHF